MRQPRYLDFKKRRRRGRRYFGVRMSMIFIRPHKGWIFWDCFLFSVYAKEEKKENPSFLYKMYFTDTLSILL